MRTTLLRRTVTAVAASALAAGALAMAAAPASANPGLSITGAQKNGQIGVVQNLTVTLSAASAPCGSIGPADIPVVTLYGGQNSPSPAVGTATFATCVGSAYQYTYAWSPATLNTTYVYAQTNVDGSNVQSNTTQSTISAVPVTTRVTAANTVTLGQPTTVTASVTANNGSTWSPQGSIQFSIQGGGNIGGPVALNNAVPSTAQVSWTPAAAGSVALLATYIPATSGGQLTTCAGSCTSAADTVQVTSTGNLMYLANPPAFSVGQGNQVIAVVTASPSAGSVTFNANGQTFASGVAVGANGQAVATWTPPTTGSFTITANWAGASGLTASASETINVGAAPSNKDTFRVTTANGSTYSPGAYSVGNGSVITFQIKTASGAAAALAVTGPCSVNGNTITVTQASGQCVATVSSPGGNGYAANQAQYVLNLTPGTQTAALDAPASGKKKKGKTYMLENASQGTTNAGQPITWKITKGKGSVCSLVFASDGSVKVKISKKGYCTVVASAPGVAGAWNAFSLTRQYQGY